MSIKLIALDLDGTLTDDNKQISDYTKQTLLEASERGARIALASGRPLLGMMQVAKRLELERVGGYLLAYNGGQIVDCKTGETIYRVNFPPELIEESVQFARDRNLAMICYDEEHIVSEGPDDEYLQHEGFNNSAPIKLVDDLPAYLNYPIVKMVICGNGDRLAQVEKEAVAQFKGRLDNYRAEPVFLEFMPLGINKAASLKRLMDMLGIDKSELMACGDMHNDISMLELAGVSVAVGNAAEDVKKAATFVSRTNNEDGVAYAVRKFVLNGETV